MIRAHTIRLNPTPEQENLFRQAAGTARFCYNWGLRVIKDALDQDVTVPTPRSLRDAFKRIRATEFPWTFNVGKSAIDGAFVNLGRAIKNFFDSRSGRVTSEGEVFENQKHLTRALRTVKRLQRSVSRKVKGSANRRKAVLKLAKAHFRVACQRKDVLHKLTTALVQQASLVGIEDLHVAGMLKNHRLAQAIADGAWAELRRQLEYKAPVFGSRVVAIGRFVASSKTCNQCGHVNDDLTLAMREWECPNPNCCAHLDRDLNAARNIRNEAVRLAGA